MQSAFRLIALGFGLFLSSTPVAAQTSVTGGRSMGSAGFGAAVVVEGGEIFVGRPGEISLFPIPPNHTGSIHVFGNTDNRWEEKAVVTSASVEVGDGFGQALAVDGNTMLVGAPKTQEGRGAAYMFRRSGPATQWQQTAVLRTAKRTAGDELGGSVVLSGDFALVGAPGHAEQGGAVVVFRMLGGAWTEIATIEGSDVSAGERFGAALDFDGERLLVGAPGPFPDLFLGGPPPAAGSAYIFELEVGDFVEVARLTSGREGPGLFGHSVVLDGDEALIGAPLGNEINGVVHRFAPSASGEWSQAGRITASTAVRQSGFGMAVARAGEDLFVGAPLAGMAYVFRASSGGDWQELQTLTMTSPMSFMGTAIAGGEDLAVVGAPGADFFAGVGNLYGLESTGGEWVAIEALIDEGGGMEGILGAPEDCSDAGTVGGFDCSEVDLVSFLPVKDLGGARGIMVNDIWGWTDPETGIEYALVGRMDAMTFVSLQDPANPLYLGELPLTEGATANMWRDVKVYADHAFIVADGAGPHGVQIFDLRQLRDVENPPVTFGETAHYDGIFSAHNIVMNEGSGFAYVVGASMGGETCGGGLHMIDVRDPTDPTFAGCFSDPATGRAGTGYSHDAQCIMYDGPDTQHQGKEVCFGANETALSIADVSDKSNPVPIATATYPNPGYVHQGWISDDHRYFYVNDELDELSGVERTRTLVWDIEDLDDPVLVKEHWGETSSSDHNLYIRGQFMYQSNYVSGLRILDISDPANPKEVGFFDSVPVGENSPGFAGSWSNYPFFESGVIVFTSMREGLFVVRKRRQPVF